jgi:tetratricopeptide (TPR) repeat protein
MEALWIRCQLEGVLGFLLAGISMLSAAQKAPVVEGQVAGYLAAAQRAEQAQDYAVASRQYEAILKLQPKLPLIRQSLAITYHLQTRYLEAISEFQRALRLDSALWGADLFLGMDYYKTNQFALAIAPLEASITLNAKMAEPEARFWLAVTYSVLDKHDEAVRELRRDLVLRPNNVDVLYYLTKEYDQAAAAAFERLGRSDQRAAAVSLLQAERFAEENRSDLARLEYRNALRLRPDFKNWIPELANPTSGAHTAADLTISTSDARANLELAALLAGAGDRQQSAAILRNLVTQKAGDVKAAEVIAEGNERLASLQREPLTATAGDPNDVLSGIQFLSERQFREAVAPLARSAKKDPNPCLQLLLVRAYLGAGDYALVEASLTKLLAAEPDNVDALLLLGRSYKSQAESTLQQMIAIDADSYGVHELLGKQHEERTEYDLAIKEYQAALAKRPDLGGIRYAIGNVYRKMNQYDQAEHWLTEELARNPYHGLAHYRLGSIYVEQGKPDAAIPHLEQALRSHPQLTDARLDLGRAYTAKGRYEEAITALKQVVIADPTNDRVHYLLSTAYSKEGRSEEARTELAAYQRLTRSRLERTQQDIKSLSNSLDHQ